MKEEGEGMRIERHQGGWTAPTRGGRLQEVVLPTMDDGVLISCERPPPPPHNKK
jgi:hypothetical protein